MLAIFWTRAASYSIMESHRQKGICQMDDYTWEKTIQRRRIRRRRQALLILVLLILALGAFFGWHSYAEKRTPEYALEQARSPSRRRMPTASGTTSTSTS